LRIAVTYENGDIFQHFGHTERFKIYDTDHDQVKLATTVNTNGSGHGALADILKKLSVDALICGSIGDGAKRALSEAHITFYGGVSGEAPPRTLVRVLVDEVTHGLRFEVSPLQGAWFQ
jgi:predicted Fe-Mo cluster-binding NifX family protein